jgi:hypothetical protein
MKRILVLSGLLVAVLLLSNFTVRMDAQKSFHSQEELELYQQMGSTPIGPGEYFQTSNSCRGCHGYDTLMQSNIDENGQDVNLFDRWEGSMMALSAKDPLWRAKVSHESLVNPAHSNALESKCTSCHAPMGHYNAIYGGATHFTLSDLLNDTLGLDGVSCAGCHTISPNVGNTFSGDIPFDTTRQIYGPFPGPFAGPMQLYEGYTPVYSPHMDESSVCSPCHTLITETIDLAGNYTGNTFVEQATYHEYLNSSFAGTSTTCQSCHMPRLADAIVIANGYITLQPRFPFNQHTFAGANSFMLNLIKNNKAALGVTASDANLDSSIAATTDMLKQKSVEFELINDGLTPDTAYYRVKIRNKAGHKFPSGYPGRRAVLQFVVTDANGDTVFQSGIFDPNYRVVGENPQFNPHYSTISQNHTSQIYEMAMGDVNGQFTSVLARAALLLKDNRIPPEGFTTASPVYDTVKVSADALADADFNKLNGVEGTGSDFVQFKVPVAGLLGNINVSARLYYQSVPPKWLDEMFTYNSSHIDTFRNMYNAADKTPVLVASDSTIDVLTALSNYADKSIKVSPTFTRDGIISVEIPNQDQIVRMEAFDASGKKYFLKNIGQAGNRNQFQLPDATGVFIVRVTTRLGSKSVRVMRL